MKKNKKVMKRKKLTQQQVAEELELSIKTYATTNVEYANQKYVNWADIFNKANDIVTSSSICDPQLVAEHLGLKVYYKDTFKNLLV